MAARYQAHPVGDVARREREMRGERLGLAATVGVMGVLLALFLLAIPFIGLVVGAALGIEMAP
jgi:hypothetical protein